MPWWSPGMIWENIRSISCSSQLHCWHRDNYKWWNSLYTLQGKSTQARVDLTCVWGNGERLHYPEMRPKRDRDKVIVSEEDKQIDSRAALRIISGFDRRVLLIVWYLVAVIPSWAVVIARLPSSLEASVALSDRMASLPPLFHFLVTAAPPRSSLHSNQRTEWVNGRCTLRWSLELYKMSLHALR